MDTPSLFFLWVVMKTQVFMYGICLALVACSPIPQKTAESGEAMASKAAKDSRAALAREDSGAIYATSAREEPVVVEDAPEEPQEPILTLLPGGVVQMGGETITAEQLAERVRGEEIVRLATAKDLPYSDLIVVMDQLRANGVKEFRLTVHEPVE